MSRSAPLVVVCAALVWGCGSDATGPTESLCATRNGVEVCVDRAQYRPLQTINYTVRNTTAGPIFKDNCSLKPVGITRRDLEFEEVFNASLFCAPGTPTDVMANMDEIGPGETLSATAPISAFAFQGFYRLNVWIVQADGTLAHDVPSHSGIFEVFPSAD